MELSMDLTHLDSERPVLVACSGGRDSIALLFALREKGYRVAVGHIDHGMRATSGRDREFVETLCAASEIPFFAACAKKGTLDSEQAARRFRYDSLKRIAESHGYPQVALAHHRGDQAETILMHLFRGTGMAGAAGMKTVKEGLFVRPLLGTPRAEIDRYVEFHNLEFVTDETNNSDHYTRNFLRHHVLSQVEKKYPEYERAVVEFAAEVRRVGEYLDSLISLPPLADGEIRLPLEMSELPKVLLERAAYMNAKRLLPQDISREQIVRIAGLFGAGCGTTLEIKGALRATRDSDCVTLYLEKETLNLSCPWSEASGEVGGWQWTLITADSAEAFLRGKAGGGSQGSETLIFDADKIPADAVWRTRVAGDRFTPFGGGTRPLKEYLIYKKIPSRSRDRLMLLCVGDTVLLVAGVEISQKIAVDENTKRRLRLERATNE